MVRETCICDGYNENCYRCYGRGYIESSKSVTAVPGSGQDYLREVTMRPVRSMNVALTGCQICGARVKSLARHMRKAHGVGKVQKIGSTPTAKKPRLTSCPECQVPVREDRLKKHIRLIHSSPEYDRQRQAPNAATSRTRSKIDAPSHQPADMGGGYEPEEDARDASRSYASQYREQGRFGSHPIHDDYSEASEP